ncbi:sporulation integral membrane protein YlbJ [Hazenella sp. IB182357]|uniref:Sporulation integral membrane protein YlbJ n=1 Tax=Polycladospora coralii TaxID=2771432 RepID=A0A926RWD8_9BACL|nr:sporulation integral membrane protein YlbJ [Polycladospora coralii]MBD1371401.1 sporulation integral membrane protein YlbJ [Polycladospora coralii]MBS7530369.1 sporulation integral membrane protein YlbJ [Polycladospora coralii]
MIQPLLRSQLKTILLAFVAFFIATILLMYPEQAFQSSLRGLTIWWDVVFPSLLPFFITAEMLMGFGAVHFLSVLLEPLMRPIFRVPGAGAFVMAVGLISGNPMGAKLTSRLREQGMVTREEGERLISFTSTAGPLFLFGAVSVGFFEKPSIGIILAIAHYSSSILVGMAMRFYRQDAPPSPSPPKREGWLLIRALSAMHRARIRDGRSLGQLLGQSVTSAIQTLLLIGGFIMMFSVLVQLIHFVGVTLILENIISSMLSFIHFPIELTDSILAGIFEITLGSQLASATVSSIPIVYALTIVSILIGWNGFSIHAQVASMISKTDIRYLPYLLARLFHGVLAGIITIIIYPLFDNRVTTLSPAMAIYQNQTNQLSQLFLFDILQWFTYITLLMWMIYQIQARHQKRIRSIKTIKIR